MAVIRINLSDNFVGLINKTNDISARVGDTNTLITGDSDVVTAINNVRGLFAGFDESAEILAIAREAISVNQDAGLGSVEYNDATGVVQFTGASIDSIRSLFTAGSGLAYDSNQGIFTISSAGISSTNLIDSTITSDKFNNKVKLDIVDADGNILKTIFSPGV